MPTLLTRSSEGDETVSELKLFFQNQNGSIAVSQAICSTHKVDLILAARKKRFTQPFLDSIVGLQKASEVSLSNSVRLIHGNHLELDDDSSHKITASYLHFDLGTVKRENSKKSICKFHQ